MTALWIVTIIVGVAVIVWGAERFAEHLAGASAALGVSAFALALLLAGAEPEELATAVAASARDAPGIAFGDVVGANVAICLVALGVGAVVAPLPFGGSVGRYARLGLPIAGVATWFVWDGSVGRLEGAVLVAMYVAFVATLWLRERRPPTLGETAETVEDDEGAPRRDRRRGAHAIVGVVLGLAGMVAGSLLLVEATRQITDVESFQTLLGLTVIGFATAFELVVLAWSTARRGVSEGTIAAVVGSITYNVTMTLGVAAIVRPLELVDGSVLRPALIGMLGAITVVTVLGTLGTSLGRRDGIALLALYPLFVVVAVVTVD
ncbi:MAG TPA: sodium:calcium antiporter [Acidimicrobiia bacterium]|nr:sodium:calcium antiporter [Acidimicrobiia bacterium]